MKTINQLKASLPIMFERLGCEKLDYAKKLGTDVLVILNHYLVFK
jgi:hypothetical protein